MLAPLPKPPPRDPQFKWISFSGAAGNPFSTSTQDGMALPSQSWLGAGGGPERRAGRKMSPGKITALLGLGHGMEAGRFPETSSEETEAALPLPPSISILAHLLFLRTLPATHRPPAAPDRWVLNLTRCLQTPTPAGRRGNECPKPTPACASISRKVVQWRPTGRLCV